MNILKIILLANLFFIPFINNIFSQSGWIQVPGHSANYKGVFFPDKDTGFVIQSDGSLLKSIDKGLSWSVISTGASAITLGSFSNSLLGSICCNPVMLSTNGGRNWSTISSNMGGSCKGISFLNDSIGYAINNGFDIGPPIIWYAILNKTTNRGQNWVEASRKLHEEFEDFYCKDEGRIRILTPHAILSTENGGVNWSTITQFYQHIRLSRARSMTNPFDDLIYVAGYVTGFGADTAVIAKTTNGGNSWTTSFRMGSKSRLTKIFLINDLTCYAIGDTGLIVGTTNGGANWLVHNSGTTRKLNGVAFINKDTGFVVGDSGVFLRTFTGGLSSISNNSQNYSTSYKLHQNYPNPFNPKTIINYQIYMINFIQLKVYNVLGNEIATLVNGKQNAGTHEVEFNSEGLSSGIYFYTLSVDGSLIDTKRMILLK